MILTGILNVENGGLEYAVVGIESMLLLMIFDDIKAIAGSIFQRPTDQPIKSILAAELLNNLSSSMDKLTDHSYLEEYKRRSFLIGKDIYVLKGKIMKLLQWILTIGQGLWWNIQINQEALSSGEVSVRQIP